MNRAQKCFIIGAEVTFACVSHLVLCRWRLGSYPSIRIGLGRGKFIFDWNAAGIELSSSLGPTAGFVFGVALPALLLALAVYQYLGWFRGGAAAEGKSFIISPARRCRLNVETNPQACQIPGILSMAIDSHRPDRSGKTDLAVIPRSVNSSRS